ncbi:MAG: hypothetical protein ABJH08_11520 [Balneola sp.]
MSSKKLSEKQTKFFGWIFALIGLPFIGMAFGIFQADESTIHAPLWVIGLCGFVFSLAGIMILLGEKSPVNNLLGGLLVLSFALIGGWVALFGDSAQFSGGSSILSDSSNVMLARILFGSGALMCFAITIYAIRQYFTK